MKYILYTSILGGHCNSSITQLIMNYFDNNVVCPWCLISLFCNFGHDIQELNTAKGFMSFYEEIFPLVQTLPLIILQKDLIVSSLLSVLKMEGRLSLEPILRYLSTR